jgi:hypothetical protein
MTELMTKAFQEASKLSHQMQDEVARRMLDDLAGESQWDATLERSQSQLDELADKAVAEFRAGKTQEMGFDEL